MCLQLVQYLASSGNSLREISFAPSSSLRQLNARHQRCDRVIGNISEPRLFEKISNKPNQKK
jgi:hypothetical protein